MQLVARKSFLAQPNHAGNDCYILLHPVHAVHQAKAYIYPFMAHALGKQAGTGAKLAAAVVPSAIVMAACQGVVVGCRHRQRQRLDNLMKFEFMSLCHSLHSQNLLVVQ
jgi:hypothetical protein